MTVSLYDGRLLNEWMRDNGFSERHADQLRTHLIRRPCGSMDDLVSGVPDFDRKCARRVAEAGRRRELSCMTSRIGAVRECARTTKLQVNLQDGSSVETVIIRQSSWTTLCISSQVGCAQGCTFCATGTMRTAKNLSAGQIVEQVVLCQRFSLPKGFRIVFMGMGEPFANYNAVIDAITTLTNPKLFGMARRHITVSTVGIIPRMKTFARDAPGVNLALSLHAPTQPLRMRIVPSGSAYPVQALMRALDEHLANSPPKTRVFVECIVIKGINDSKDVGRQLGALICEGGPKRKEGVILNLIPYNPTKTKETFEAPSPADVTDLQKCLTDEFGLRCYTRREMGQDIDSACGQLVLESNRKRQSAEIEDIVQPSVPTLGTTIPERPSQPARPSILIGVALSCICTALLLHTTRLILS
ncbi:unnamed protein product (mitochondrion) [Plasmodiophora brassicae]|uniref:Radical SAM core domain-containing protein n=1 Tax=Plasmodiophora brassicae TaxID=37360 RepID=A0A0G4J3H0_PLABS|nr:hypothetical protein PBRA_002357 [Plasmodiophora brassicae]SPQ93714.1 unnamed protein product [Plasmodiophora brassicae]